MDSLNTFNTTSSILNHSVANADQAVYNQIFEGNNTKQQLKKAATEFESIFITKMLSEMDKTVDRSEGVFGKESQYQDMFKSIVFQQMGRDIASNPRTSFGLADSIYKQMEHLVN